MKKLKDYTFGEIYDECNNRTTCDDCKFEIICSTLPLSFDDIFIITKIDVEMEI